MTDTDMELEDNFALITAYNVEDSHPRKLPRAFPFNKVTPIPLVPDVSLVFDNNQKSVKQCSVDRNAYHEESLNGDGSYSCQTDDSGPRKVKPMPIAPFPNETYAAWRARAANAQHVTSPGLITVTHKSAMFKQVTNEPSVSFPTNRKLNDPANGSSISVNVGPQDTCPITERRNFAQLNGQTQNEKFIRRVVEDNRACLHNELFQEKSTMPTTEKGVSNSLTEASRSSHAIMPRSPMVNKEHKHNVGCVSEDRLSSVQPVQNRKEKLSPVFKEPSDWADSHQVVTHHSPTDTVSGFGTQGDCNEIPVVIREEGSSKKRDALRDLYRIIQLQNEQLKSLQSQVERLLRKNREESPRCAESIKAKEKPSTVHYVEESTQTSYDDPDNVISVGVMTSFIHSDKEFSGDDNLYGTNDPYFKSKGCQCSAICNEKAPNETGSNTEKVQAFHCYPGKYGGASNIPVNRKYDVSRPPTKNVRHVHQVIEEENESDDGVQQHQCNLNKEIGSQSKDKGCQHKEVMPQQEQCGRNSDGNKSSKQESNTGRPSAIKPLHLESGGQKDRVSSDSGVPSPIMANRIHERVRKNSKHLHLLQNHKCCPDRTATNHDLVARSQQNEEEMTMTLNGVNLQTVTEPQISPEPSIHVDIQDYQEFSGEAEASLTDESYYSENGSSCSSDHKEDVSGPMDRRQINDFDGNKVIDRSGDNRNTKVGWTFYNNVLGQVNELLENQKGADGSPVAKENNFQDTKSVSKQTAMCPMNSSPPVLPLSNKKPHPLASNSNNLKAMAKPTLEVVREATLQHLKRLGIDLSSDQDKHHFSLPVPNVPCPVGRDFSDGRRVTFDPNGTKGKLLGERHPTETSLRIKALAQKYLSEEQLASYGYLGLKERPQEPVNMADQPSNLPQGVIGEVSSSADFTLYGMNGTNLSFATLRYLQRYHLLPCNGTSPAGIWRHQDGIQQANFSEAATMRGACIGDTRSPEQIDYTNDYMEGFRQGANMAMGLQGQSEKVHFSTPANKVDSQLPSSRMKETGKEVCYAQTRRDFPHVRQQNCAGMEESYPRKNTAAKPRRVGKQKGLVQRDGGGVGDRIGHKNHCLQANTEGERTPNCNVQKEQDQKQRLHPGSQKSSNILDITALRQQPKLL